MPQALKIFACGALFFACSDIFRVQTKLNSENLWESRHINCAGSDDWPGLAMRLGIWKIPLVSRRIKPVRHVRAYLVDRISCSCKRTGIATLSKKNSRKIYVPRTSRFLGCFKTSFPLEYEPDCHRRRPKNEHFGSLLQNGWGQISVNRFPWGPMNMIFLK